MANPLTLKLILAGASKAVNELRPLDKQSRTTAEGLKKSRDALKLLNTQLGQIDGIQKQQAALDKQSRALRDLDAQLSAVIAKEGIKSAQASKLAQQLLTQQLAYNKQRTSLDELQVSAQKSGLSLGRLGSEQTRLRSEVESTNAAITQQKARLEALGAQQARHAAVQQRYNGTKAMAGNMAMAGAAGIGVAYGVRRAVAEPLAQIREYQTTTARIGALGLGKNDTQDVINYANGLKAYGLSKNDKMSLALDASTAFADAHEAKMVLPTLADMKFANSAMFGREQGAENERKFMDLLKVVEARGGLKDKNEFVKQADMVQRVITATGGRVDSTQWLDFIKRGGIAAKGLSSEAMYYQLEPIVQIMGGASAGVATMSAYQNLYQGRTTKRAAANLEKFGLIGDMSKVKHDKAGQVSFLDPGALKGADLFRTNQFEWMEKVLLPALAAKGITDPQKINDAIGSIFSNRTASGLFSQMYLMRDQIHKNAKLNAGADGIDELKAKAKDNLGGKELEAQAKFHDAMLSAGKALEPTYVKLLNVVTPLLEGFSKFIADNPQMASALGAVALTVGVAAAGFGTLGIALAAMLGPWAIVRYSLGLVGIKLPSIIGMVRGLATSFTALGGVSGIFLRLGVAFQSAGGAVGLLSGLFRRMFMVVFAFARANPLIATLMGIGGAIYGIMSRWDEIKGYFKAGEWMKMGAAIWEGLEVGLNAATLGLYSAAKAVFVGLIDLVKGLFGIASPSRVFFEFGVFIVQGLIDGITSMITSLGTAISGMADSTIGWFKDKLGIRSPSRVFIEAGANIGEGAALGIDRTRPLLRAAALGLAGATAGALPAMAAAFPLADGVIDNRPPLAAGGAGRGRAPINIQGDTITINITAAPGGDAQALARAIRAELERMEVAKRARMRGAFLDLDN